MKTFRSEFINNYSSYTFSFADYAVIEEENDYLNAYEAGYLPYSNNIDIESKIFYLARSLRVDLSRFQDSSENKRVDRKMEFLEPKITLHKLTPEFYSNPIFFDFCYEYTKRRFAKDAMNKDRLQYIFESGIGTHIFEFSSQDNNKILGYVLAVIFQNNIHYWFSFYDDKLLENLPIGKWMMWRTIKWAKENSFDNIYLGTVYLEKALYKIRDFKGVQYFNGNNWSNDIDTLKYLCKHDNIPRESDLFKNMDNPNLFLQTL